MKANMIFEQAREQNLFCDQTEAMLPAWACFFLLNIFLYSPSQRRKSQRKILRDMYRVET